MNERRRATWLYRGRLRDVVVVLCVASTLFLRAGAAACWAAVAFLAVGCALHVLVKGQLVRNVVLCTDGAYAVARHPYYLANYLIDVAFCLLSGNVFLVVLYPFLFFWAYGAAFREEESRLAAAHGPAFEAYRASVPQVFPDETLWSRWPALGKGFSWDRVTSGEIKRIVRFAFLGSLLLLSRTLGPEGWREIVAGRNPFGAWTALLAVSCGALLVASVLIPRRPEPSDRPGDEKPPGGVA